VVQNNKHLHKAYYLFLNPFGGLGNRKQNHSFHSLYAIGGGLLGSDRIDAWNYIRAAIKRQNVQEISNKN
jgi:hypothetical protein